MNSEERSDDGAEPAAARQLTSPYVQVLGTAQDGGLPHAACRCSRCERARTEPTARRLVASLALVLPAREKVFLFDATPDLREQLIRLRDVRNPPTDRVDRSPVDGVFLTHTHIGHYLGLAFFGFEAVHTRSLPVYCTSSTADFLRRNGPWSQLVTLENLELRESAPGKEIQLDDAVSVTPLEVPHRNEYSDTVGFVISGPKRRLLYVPDTDGWQHWDTPLTEILSEQRIDVALLDATFYSLEELPGRKVSSVGHPLVTESMDLLQAWVEDGAEVYFTHLNHSNPLLEATSQALTEVENRGFAVLRDGQILPL